MYIRTPRAMVWVEPAQQDHRPPTSPRASPTAHSQERWALKPLVMPDGHYVAVRLRAGQLELGWMAANRLRWRPDLPSNLSEKKLQKWLEEGF